MFAHLVSLLAFALLAPIVAAMFQTNLQEGEIPDSKLEHLGHFAIPAGQCSGDLDLSTLCISKPHVYGGPTGVRALKATIEDNRPAEIVFSSINNKHVGKLNNVVVYRNGDCKGKIHLQVYYECDSIRPPRPKQTEHDAAAIIPPAKPSRRRNDYDNTGYGNGMDILASFE